MASLTTTSQRIAKTAKAMICEMAIASHRTATAQLTVVVEEAYSKWKKEQANERA